MLLIMTALKLLVPPALLALFRHLLVRRRDKLAERTRAANALRVTCLDFEAHALDAIGECQRIHGLKPRYGWMTPNIPTYRALQDAKRHTAAVTRLRAELRGTAPLEVGDAADELLERLIQATVLMQAPRPSTDWPHLWDEVGEARRRFDSVAGIVAA
jgi:hypothetical protein